MQYMFCTQGKSALGYPDGSFLGMVWLWFSDFIMMWSDMELYFDLELWSSPRLVKGRSILFFDAEQQPRATASDQPLWSQGETFNPTVCCVAKLGYSVGIFIYIDWLIDWDGVLICCPGWLWTLGLEWSSCLTGIIDMCHCAWVLISFFCACFQSFLWYLYPSCWDGGLALWSRLNGLKSHSALASTSPKVSPY